MREVLDKQVLLAEGNWGIEREAIRTGLDGFISRKQHPLCLSSRNFLKDFSESQIEIVSSVHSSIAGVLEELTALHTEALAAMDGEFLWPLSMPPMANEYSSVYPAVFQGSAQGEAKESYRRYLLAKYGSAVMHISGIHVNFSYPASLLQALYSESGRKVQYREFTDRVYLEAAMTLLGFLPLCTYVFGASPQPGAYLGRHMTQAGTELKHTAVSIRNSHYGYRNPDNKNLSFKSVTQYTNSIRELIGSARLASEKEVYAPLRLKPLHPGICCETALDALDREGIAYFEIRIPDLNPYSDAGITSTQLHFLRLILMHALLRDPPASPSSDGLEYSRAVTEFEDFSLHGAAESYRSRAIELGDELVSTAGMLDSAERNHRNADLITLLRKALAGETPLLFEQILEDSRLAGSTEAFAMGQTKKGTKNGAS